jgi:hypothetical protein
MKARLVGAGSFGTGRIARATLAGAALITLASTATPAGATDLSLHKSPSQWTLEGKNFHLSEGGETEFVSMYGLTRRHFFADDASEGGMRGWYWGEAVYGAVAGRRGGYFEGGGVLGYQTALWRDSGRSLLADARLFSGAGGGGGVSEGGGWIVQPAAGLGMAWSPRVRTFAQAGYARFVNGDIQGWTWGLTLHYAVWDLQ